MSGTSLSVLLPQEGDAAGTQETRERIAAYLESIGFRFEIVIIDRKAGENGTALRRGVADSHGDVVVVVDADLPYGVEAIGDAVAMIQSGAAGVVFGLSDAYDETRFPLLRLWLVDRLPDPALELMAFSAHAARLVVGEGALSGSTVGLEIAFLANKYGFRVESLHVRVETRRRRRSFSSWSIAAVIAIRMRARRMGYRASRRCPVCFANDVWTAAQIAGNLVRACSRCKCRYLNEIAPEEEDRALSRPAEAPPSPPLPVPEGRSQRAREKSSARRLATLQQYLSPRARILEIGIRDGGFGIAASRFFEYVGIDSSPVLARSARGKGLDTYCSTLSGFVNVGAMFDAVALFHVIENLPDPHDALGRIKDLLKPGGVLFLTTFDTEGLLYLMTERKRLAQAFRTHVILYSRSALIELLEHSGFEIEVIGPDFDYRDHRFLRHLVATRWPVLEAIAAVILRLLPDPLLVGTGSIRIIAKRRTGPPLDLRTIRSAEATHAR